MEKKLYETQETSRITLRGSVIKVRRVKLLKIWKLLFPLIKVSFNNK